MRTIISKTLQGDSSWSKMNGDVMGLIFSKLSEKCVCTAAIACKRWYTVADDATFLEFYTAHSNSTKSSKFFSVHGAKYCITYEEGRYVIQSFDQRYNVPTVACPEEGEIPCVEAAGGLKYALTESCKQMRVHYKLCSLEKTWRVTSEMPYLMQDPVAGVVNMKSGESGNHKLVFVGGEICLVGEDGDDLAVIMYDAQRASWESCDRLPNEFSSRTCSLFMDSVVHRGVFYAYDKFKGYVSELHTEYKQWSEVRSLCPPEEVSELLLVSQPNGLALLGIQDADERDLCFKVWSVDEDTMRVGDLLHNMIVHNARARPPSAIVRQTARTCDTLSRCAGLVLIFIFCMMLLCHSATVQFFKGLTKLRLTAHNTPSSARSESHLSRVTSALSCMACLHF